MLLQEGAIARAGLKSSGAPVRRLPDHRNAAIDFRPSPRRLIRSDWVSRKECTMRFIVTFAFVRAT